MYHQAGHESPGGKWEVLGKSYSKVSLRASVCPSLRRDLYIVPF